VGLEGQLDPAVLIDQLRLVGLVNLQNLQDQVYLVGLYYQ
jgi:hypothetical protein